MARVTVEDCVTKVPNRFELVMRASHRAREIASGGAPTVERDNDKNPVIALREIADGTVDLEEIEDALIKNLQKFVEADEPEEDQLGFDMPGEASEEEVAAAVEPTGAEQTGAEQTGAEQTGAEPTAAEAEQSLAGGFEDIATKD